MNYNPMQQRLDSIDSQIQMLQQQKATIQQYQPMPPIQQTFIQQPSVNSCNFDFNGKWVNNLDEAKELSNNNLPLLIFDKSNSMFYMKQLNGQMTAYEYHQVELKDDKDRQIDLLKCELDELKERFKTIKSNTEGVNISESII